MWEGGWLAQSRDNGGLSASDCSAIWTIENFEEKAETGEKPKLVKPETGKNQEPTSKSLNVGIHSIQTVLTNGFSQRRDAQSVVRIPYNEK